MFIIIFENNDGCMYVVRKCKTLYDARKEFKFLTDQDDIFLKQGFYTIWSYVDEDEL